jgi:hypothetical protein
MAQNNNVPAVPKLFQPLIAYKNRQRVEAAGLINVLETIWSLADEMKIRDPDLQNEELLAEAIEYVMCRLWFEEEVRPQLERAFASTKTK